MYPTKPLPVSSSTCLRFNIKSPFNFVQLLLSQNTHYKHTEHRVHNSVHHTGYERTQNPHLIAILLSIYLIDFQKPTRNFQPKLHLRQAVFLKLFPIPIHFNHSLDFNTKYNLLRFADKVQFQLTHALFFIPFKYPHYLNCESHTNLNDTSSSDTDFWIYPDVVLFL